MKLVFYYPCKFTHAHATIHGPMGLTYIAAHLQKELGLEEIHIEVDPYRVIDHKPDLVGVSAYTETYPQALEGAWEIKKALDIPLMLGGPHMNAIPEKFPKDGPFDVGIHGEGEHNTVELVRGLLKNSWGPSAFRDIPGAVFYDGGEEAVLNPKATSNDALDTLYYPRREILQAWFPTDGKVGQWRQGLYTSRDCPFRCRFCIHSTIQGMPRYHSIERVITELEHILRYYPQQKMVTIYDDIFVVSKKRLAELVAAIREAGIHKHLGFVAMVKPSTFNEEVCQLLREMNVKMISFGFETGSAEVLKYLKGPGTRLVQHQESVDICHRYNLRCTGYFIMGSPVETPQDLAKTYWFIRHNVHHLYSAGLFSLIPYPGTKFWYDYEERRGSTPDERGWEVFDHKYLEWDTHYPFFINQHYSEEFLVEAFAQFKKVRPRLAQDPHWQMEEDRMQGYKRALYQYIQPLIGTQTQVLEIGKLPNSYYETYQFEALPITLYDDSRSLFPWPQGQVFEAIYLNHALEQSHEPGALLQQLHQVMDGQTTLYISFYNAIFLPFVYRLLKGLPLEIFEPPYLMQIFRYFTFPKMLSLLQKNGFQVLDIHRNPQPLDQSGDSFRILPALLESVAHPELRRDFNVYSYLLVVKRQDG